jgi:hypothetical protein
MVAGIAGLGTGVLICFMDVTFHDLLLQLRQVEALPMHEVRATVPVQRRAAIAQIAIDAGIANVSVYDVFAHGPERRKHVVSAECSTPKAKAFIDALLSSPIFDVEECSISSRELRALISGDPLAQITRPMVEPVPDIIEDFWQLSP